MRELNDCRSLQGLKFLLLLLLTATCGAHVARAQADATASKTADLSVFAGYTYTDPDYASYFDNGGTAGVDYTRYFRWRIVPSIEARINYNAGYVINEKSALGGLRLKMDLHRYHPYATALFGGTEIIYKFPPDPRNDTDRAFTSSYGGGVDIDVTRSFQLKLDLQKQFENYGPNGTKLNNADFTLSPTLATVGIVYRFFQGNRDSGPH